MSDTIKIGRKPNSVTIKRCEAYYEMFTTNIDRIKQFIAVSDYPDKIDPRVILKINEQAVRLSEDDFDDYFDDLDDEEQIMMYLYECTINPGYRKRIIKIIKKVIDPNEPCSERDLIDLMHWESGKHGYYHAMTALERGELV